MKNKYKKWTNWSIYIPFLESPQFYLITIILFSTIMSCSENMQTDINNGRYQYPNYINGNITISHSWYRACEDTTFNHSSKEFVSGDTVYALITEVLGPDWQAPEMGLDETAEIICSNGDIEIFTFNFPYPECMIHIDGVLIWFSGIKTQQSINVIPNNNFIEVDRDSLVIVVHYKSYWTGNIVTDTAYINH